MVVPQLSVEYSHLKPVEMPSSIVYGPVQSRRLGLSLGVNLLGAQKVCSFDCGYCELGRSHLKMKVLKSDYPYPDLLTIKAEVRSGLLKVTNEQLPIDHLTISGHGEPTLHPQFLECIEAIVAARDELAPNLKIVALTNGAHCENKRVVHGLNLIDERMVKLDAGNDNTYKLVNAPLVRGHIAKIVSGARRLKDVIIQSLFIHGTINNTSSRDIEEWLELVGIVRPKAIHIMTLDRIPAITGLRRVDEDTLYTIASLVKRKLQIETSVFS